MWWTADELCNELKMKKSTLYQMTSGRRIPFIKMGGFLRFDPDEIGEWLNGKRISPIDAA
jgi:excisionase family DNA binding protein